MEEIVQYQKPAPDPGTEVEAVAVAPGPAPESPAESARRRRPAPTTIAIILLIVAVLVESVLLFRGDSDKRSRSDALEVSRRFLALLSTYSPTTLEAQKAKVLELATGRFPNDYAQVYATLALTVQQEQVNAKASVTRAAVNSIDGDSATVLAVVQVTSTNKDRKTPRIDEFLMELTLVHTKRGWKVDSATNLGSIRF
jgi:Mce-associated membrane protein